MPFIPIAIVGGLGLWGGFVLSEGTKRLSWLMVLALVVWAVFSFKGSLL
ncbi:TPA: hypothetical protein ACGUT1_002858 [Vibrio vulnificus]